MAADKRITVGVALTPDPGLLPVLRGLVNRMAEQIGFGESQRANLQQGVGRACRWVMERCGGDGQPELHLWLTGFADRMEIMVEDRDSAAQIAEADYFLLTQLLDRVWLETTDEGKVRMTLVKYLAHGESQP